MPIFGKIAHREGRTFDRKQAASAWLEKREAELAKPGAPERQKDQDPTLAVVIDRYVDESIKKIGRTKAQVLRAIKSYDIANKRRDADEPRQYIEAVMIGGTWKKRNGRLLVDGLDYKKELLAQSGQRLVQEIERQGRAA